MGADDAGWEDARKVAGQAIWGRGERLTDAEWLKQLYETPICGAGLPGIYARALKLGISRDEWKQLADEDEAVVYAQAYELFGVALQHEKRSREATIRNINQLESAKQITQIAEQNGYLKALRRMWSLWAEALELAQREVDRERDRAA